jgi:hypothetical protein
LLALLLLGAALAQTPPPPPAEGAALYGEPEDVTLGELVGMAASRKPARRAYRTHGRFDSTPAYSLCEGRLCLTPIQPVEAIAKELAVLSPSFHSRLLEVVGAFEDGRFVFWSYALATADSVETGRAGGSSLQDLVNRKGPFEDRAFTVVGQFRGANLFSDLPAGSGATLADWVISDGPFSVWVTGKPPRGKGFSLHPGSPADCVYWLEIEGRPQRLGEVVVLKAGRIRFLGRSPKVPEGPERR